MLTQVKWDSVSTPLLKKEKLESHLMYTSTILLLSELCPLLPTVLSL